MAFLLKRVAARVVCLDPERRVLLISAADPADRSKLPWWELPGGGLDPGELHTHAIERELLEEAGIEGAEIGPCIWTQHARFRFAGWDFDQHERIHVATCSGEVTAATRLEAFEAAAFRGQRWWPLAELLASDEPTVPPRLREFIAPIVAGDYPAEPIDISPADGAP